MKPLRLFQSKKATTTTIATANIAAAIPVHFKIPRTYTPLLWTSIYFSEPPRIGASLPPMTPPFASGEQIFQRRSDNAGGIRIALPERRDVSLCLLEGDVRWQR